MAVFERPKKIKKEDYPADQQKTIDSLGYIINSTFENIYNAFQKNINFDNLPWVAQTTLYVKVDANGNPVTDNNVLFNNKLINLTKQVKNTASGSFIGFIVTNATSIESTVNSPIYATNQPFISYTIGSNTPNIINISNISGLPANKIFSLNVILMST